MGTREEPTSSQQIKREGGRESWEERVLGNVNWFSPAFLPPLWEERATHHILLPNWEGKMHWYLGR